MPDQTASNSGKRKQRQPRVFAPADYLGMLTAIITDARLAGLLITTRNDEGRRAWVIEIYDAEQVVTPEGLVVRLRAEGGEHGEA